MLEYFRHAIIKRVLYGFGTLFNDIWVARYDLNGNEVNRIKVPIDYGPKQKFMVRITEDDPELIRSGAMYLPRMAYEITNITYDKDRKLQTVQRSVVGLSDTNTQLGSRFEKVPYILSFNLYVIAKNDEDAFQILEQIFPYFGPDFCISFKTFPIDAHADVPISIGQVSFDESYENDFKERKVFLATIAFEAKINFYGPVNRSKIITKSQVDLLDYKTIVPIGITAGPRGDMTYYGITGATFATVLLTVTGGATAGSIGATGSIQKTITEYP